MAHLQKIINLLDGATNRTHKYRTKTSVEGNDDTKTGSSDVADQIKSQTTIIRSRLCDFSGAHILVKGTKTNTGAGAEVVERKADERNKPLRIFY